MLSLAGVAVLAIVLLGALLIATGIEEASVARHRAIHHRCPYCGDPT